MKSGNPRRPSTAPPHGARSREADASLGADRERADDSGERSHFVFHQQELARRALSLGAPGAARAAVWPLQAADFDDPAAAVDRLRVIRDPSATEDEVIDAIMELLRIEPLGGFPTDRATVRVLRLVR